MLYNPGQELKVPLRYYVATYVHFPELLHFSFPTYSDVFRRDATRWSIWIYLRLPRFSILLAKRVTKVTIEIWHIGLWSRVWEAIQERIIDDVVHILHRNGSSNHSTLIYLHDFASKILYGFICKIVSIIHEKKEKKTNEGVFSFSFWNFQLAKKKYCCCLFLPWCHILYRSIVVKTSTQKSCKSRRSSCRHKGGWW